MDEAKVDTLRKESGPPEKGWGLFSGSLNLKIPQEWAARGMIRSGYASILSPRNNVRKKNRFFDFFF